MSSTTGYSGKTSLVGGFAPTVTSMTMTGSVYVGSAVRVNPNVQGGPIPQEVTSGSGPSTAPSGATSTGPRRDVLAGRPAMSGTACACASLAINPLGMTTAYSTFTRAVSATQISSIGDLTLSLAPNWASVDPTGPWTSAVAGISAGLSDGTTSITTYHNSSGTTDASVWWVNSTEDPAGSVTAVLYDADGNVVQAGGLAPSSTPTWAEATGPLQSRSATRPWARAMSCASSTPPATRSTPTRAWPPGRRCPAPAVQGSLTAGLPAKRDYRGAMTVLAIDVGTTGVTALLVSTDASIVARGYREFPSTSRARGWVEHDPAEIWAAVRDACGQALAGDEEPTAIGITNQRETLVLWDRETLGSPMKAIVWRDRRTAGICAQLRADGHGEEVERLTGLRLDPYFTGTKLTWVKDNAPHVWAASPPAHGGGHGGLLRHRTADAGHVAHHRRQQRQPNAAIQPRDRRLGRLAVRAVRGPRDALPEIVASYGEVATTDPDCFFGLSIPIAGIAGDQQAALFGQACFSPGRASAPTALAPSCSSTPAASWCAPSPGSSPPSPGSTRTAPGSSRSRARYS